MARSIFSLSVSWLGSILIISKGKGVLGELQVLFCKKWMRTEILDPNPDTLLRAVDSANCHHALHGIVKSFFDLIDSA